MPARVPAEQHPGLADQETIDEAVVGTDGGRLAGTESEREPVTISADPTE